MPSKETDGLKERIDKLQKEHEEIRVAMEKSAAALRVIQAELARQAEKKPPQN